jgi:hypothetical protein
MTIPRPESSLAQVLLACVLIVGAVCLLGIAQYSVRAIAPSSLWTNSETTLSTFVSFSGISVAFYTILISVVIIILKVVSFRKSTTPTRPLANNSAETVLLISYIVCALTLALCVYTVVRAPIDAAAFPIMSRPTEVLGD